MTQKKSNEVVSLPILDRQLPIEVTVAVILKKFSRFKVAG